MEPPNHVGSTAMYWTQVFLSGCGILLNVLFLRKNSRKRGGYNALDYTLLFASITKIVTGIELTLRALVILFAHKMYADIYKYLGPIDLFMDGTYLWTLLIRNGVCSLVIRNIELPQNATFISGKIKTSILIFTAVVALFSLGYGIRLRLPSDHFNVYIDYAIFSINGFVKQLPLVLITGLSIWMSGKIGHILYKRRHSLRAQRSLNNSSPVRSNEILKQSLLVLTFQCAFFVAPAWYVNTIEVVEKTYEMNMFLHDITKETYWLTRCILIVFNPVVFGPAKLGKRNGHQNPTVDIHGAFGQGIAPLNQKHDADKIIKDAAQSLISMKTKRPPKLAALDIFTVGNSSPEAALSRQNSLYSIYTCSPKSLNNYQLLPPIKTESDAKKDSDNDTSMNSPIFIYNKIYTQGIPTGVGSACISPTSLFSVCSTTSHYKEKNKEHTFGILG